MITKEKEDAFVKQLFDRMGPTYSLMNVISSFGFSEFWRWSCVAAANISEGTTVCDMMAGSGECWRYVPTQVDEIISVDFSNYMSQRQTERSADSNRQISVRCENALNTSIEDRSVDHVVSAFGLKTLTADATEKFAEELIRILKPGGTFSLVEISIPKNAFIRSPYLWYLSTVIPTLGKVFLGDIECYKMLGLYTKDFDSCDRGLSLFEKAGLSVELKSHFFGCATSLVGSRPK